jgi:hypothetical protein
VLPKFMGIHLAVWLVVASALAGAVTMGGAAIAAERQRQRSRRDSDNVSGLRAVLDGFQIALAKQVRDGVRTVQQDLRRVLTGAITQRGLTLSAEATAAQQAVDQISRMGDALSDINADLTSMRELRDRARQLARPEDPQPETRPLAASAS